MSVWDEAEKLATKPSVWDEAESLVATDVWDEAEKLGTSRYRIAGPDISMPKTPWMAKTVSGGEPTSERIPLKRDIFGALKEIPENLWIGTINIGASALSAIKRRGMQLVGAGVVPDEMIRPQYEVVRPSKKITATERDLFGPSREYGPGVAAEAFGLVTRLPDVGARILRSKAQKLSEKQQQVTMENAPVMRLARSVFQSGVPSMGIAIGTSLLTGSPLVGLAILGETEGGAAFEEQLKAGGSLLKANIIGDLSAAAEIGGEMLVFPKIIKGIKRGVSFRQALTLIAENAMQEGVTGFNQRFLEVFGKETTKGTNYRKATELAFNEGLKAIPENAWVGGATAGLVEGVTITGQQAAKTVQKIKEIRKPLAVTPTKETVPVPPPVPEKAEVPIQEKLEMKTKPPAPAKVGEKPAAKLPTKPVPAAWKLTDKQFKTEKWPDYSEATLLPSEYAEIAKGEGKFARDLVYELNQDNIGTADTHRTENEIIIQVGKSNADAEAVKAFADKHNAKIKVLQRGAYIHIPIAKPPAKPVVEAKIVEIKAKQSPLNTETTKIASTIDEGINKPPTDIANVGTEENPPYDSGRFQVEVDKLTGQTNWQLEQNRVAFEKRQKQFKSRTWEAITIWIQYHNNPELLAKYEAKADPATKKLINQSRNLTTEQLQAAKQLEKEYAQDWQLAKDMGVIEGHHENYINQIWQLERKGRRLFGKQRFGAKPTEAQRRLLLKGYLQGIIDLGYKPLTLDASKLRRIYKENLVRAINQKVFLEAIRDMVNVAGEKLLIPISKVKDWKKYEIINHPALMRYVYRGSKVKEAKGKGLLGSVEKVTRDTYLQKVPLAIHKAAAPQLRALLEKSWFRTKPVFKEYLKFSALGKYMVLSFSGFHHTALGKTAIFYGVNPLPWGPKTYKAGLDLIENNDPIVEFLVKEGGLTLSTSSRVTFATEVASEGLSYIAKKLGIAGRGVTALKRYWDDALWRHYYVGLKALSAKIWYQKVRKLYPNLSDAEVARIAAKEVNDNFGGLNWERLGVSETALDFFRMTLLAPDWTLSNWRMFFDASKTSNLARMLSEKMRKGEPLGRFGKLAFGEGKNTRAMTRYMMRAFFTLGLLTMAVNIMLWGNPFPQDDDDKSTKWWMVKLPYQDERRRHYYMDIFGHFFEPIKAASNPARWAAGKRAFGWRNIEEQLRGVNWRDDYIGNIEDLAKGNLYRSKWDKWPEPGMFGWKQAPNRIIHSVSAFAPIPLRMGVDIAIGERKPVEALSSVGLFVRRGRPEMAKRQKAAGLFRRRKKGKRKSLFRKAG